MISNPEKHDRFYPEKLITLAKVIALVTPIRRIETNSQDYIVYPKIVFGAKAYHFCKNNNNRFKELTKVNLNAIPNNQLSYYHL